MRNTQKISLFAAALSLFLVGCGSSSNEPSTKPEGSGAVASGSTAPSDLAGKINIDGSTTVYPIVSAIVEDFSKANKNVVVTANKAGTGSGFQKFERGEIEIATASRPIKAEEEAKLKAKGIDFIEIPIAYDGVSIIVSKSNTAIDKITTEELKKAWSEGSTVKSWADVRAGLPADKVTFYGPTDNHGTYEYFTEAINGKKNSIRKEYQPNQEYTAIVNSVAGDKNGIAFVGYNYFAENTDKIKAIPVNGILPSEETIANGTYTPLSRPLFLYVSKAAMEKNGAVKAFVSYALSKMGDDAVKEAKYVVLPAETKAAIAQHVSKLEVGTKFKDFKPGNKLTDLYKSK